MSTPTITPSMFFKYAACPHWLWYDLYGDPARKGETPALMEKLLQMGVMHEEDYIRGLDLQPVLTADQKAAAAQTLALMQSGAPLIYQGALEATVNGSVWRGRPDLLEKRPGRSAFGDWTYVPVDIKSSHSVHDTQALQLAFYALLLERVQDDLPKEAFIINVDHERVPLELKASLFSKTKKKAGEIARILRGEKPPLRLGSKCKHSPWYKECIRSAEEANDICLVYDLDPRAADGLRAEGIRTVADAAAMRVESLPKIPHAPAHELSRIKLQAQALLDGDLHWLKAPEMPSAPLEMYFDIEGDPLLAVEYLFGFWIVGDRERRYAKIGQVRDKGEDGYFLYFLAETPEDEGKMWADFVRWTDLLPETGFAVYHFADYERSRTKNLAERYGDSPGFRRFFKRYADLSKTVQDSVIFPLYFYSIKDIAKSKFLAYKWRHQKAGGAQSIFWYEKWLETKDPSVLSDIVDYNEDDVVATRALHVWLREQGGRVVS